jgi:hypothetical protein
MMELYIHCTIHLHDEVFNCLRIVPVSVRFEVPKAVWHVFLHVVLCNVGYLPTFRIKVLSPCLRLKSKRLRAARR